MPERFYTTFESPLGLIELETDGNTLTAAVFVDERRRAPKDHALLLEAERQLRAYFEGEIRNFELPLGQPGTEFQQKVWSELGKIPYSKTISYLELSKRIGDVKAIRAVGLANGRNNLAIIVPCHRVIGSNGSLTGYAGGLWRKEWLLRHERESVFGKQEALF